jgi:hypothetical protein
MPTYMMEPPTRYNHPYHGRGAAGDLPFAGSPCRGRATGTTGTTTARSCHAGHHGEPAAGLGRCDELSLPPEFQPLFRSTTSIQPFGSPPAEHLSPLMTVLLRNGDCTASSTAQVAR